MKKSLAHHLDILFFSKLLENKRKSDMNSTIKNIFDDRESVYLMADEISNVINEWQITLEANQSRIEKKLKLIFAEQNSMYTCL